MSDWRLNHLSHWYIKHRGGESQCMGMLINVETD